MRSSRRKSSKKPCPIQGICRICSYVNSDYEKSLAEKHGKELNLLDSAGLLARARIHRAVASPRKLGYRTVFKLAVRKNPDKKSESLFRLGLFDPGTHSIGPDLTACPLHHSQLRKFLKLLHPLLEESGLKPYDESDQSGDLRYLIARTNQSGQQLMVTWVVTQPKKESLIALTKKIREQGLEIDVSAMNVNSDLGNAIWGPKTILLGEQESIQEKIAGLSFNLGPTSFFQVNPWQAENIYLRIEKMARKLSRREIAWDLFSGVGTISCVLGKVFPNVLSLEENPEAALMARQNIELNRLEKRVHVVSGLVENCISNFSSEIQNPDLVVVNPSRRGIHQKARDKILAALESKPESELIYLSCDVNTFKRDLIQFHSKGLSVAEIQGFDMHAQTSQVEWLGRLTWR